MRAILLAVAFIVPLTLFGQQPDCDLTARDTVRTEADPVRSSLVVIVADTIGRPLEGASVIVETLSRDSGSVIHGQSAGTNARGVLRVDVPANEPYVIRVRRIGTLKKCVKGVSHGANAVDTLRFTLAYDVNQFRGHSAPAIAPPDTTPTDSARFNPVARAARLSSLHATRLDSGDRELRLWYGGWGEPEYMLRIRKHNGRIHGQLFLWWERYVSYTDDSFERKTRRLVRENYSCSPVRRSASGSPTNRTETFVCEARFMTPPNWSEVLRRLEENRVWTLPDPSALPSGGMVTTDGWGITGEVKIGGHYRTYEYINPRTTVSPIPGYAIKLGDVMMDLVAQAHRRPSKRAGEAKK